MRVLITGIDGYIGCVLAPYLMVRGHRVVGLDSGFYRDGWLFSEPARTPGLPHTVVKDLRQVTRSDFEGIDAVIHLAELSNDPLGENKPEVTFEINHRGSLRVAEAAKAAGVRRFLYASSCSVYGVGTGEFMTEASPTNPQTAYARCKLLVERDVAPLADERFCVVFLRNATAYGPSPRMRFDIVLNDLCARAWTEQQIVMTSDGTPWRPVVHIEDICEAFYRALEAPAGAVNGQVFNVGDSGENYRVRELAAVVADVFPGCTVSVGPPGADNRSYRVSCDRISTVLSGFKCRWTVRKGAEQFRALFSRIEFASSTYQFRAFTRLTQLRYLQRSGQLNEQLYWNY